MCAGWWSDYHPALSNTIRGGSMDKLTEEAKIAFDTGRHHAAAHAMQTGVAYEQSKGSDDGTAKHLRTGINAAMSDQAGLVRLLIAKGIITQAEYTQAIADEMEHEVERYHQRNPGVRFL
jgi:hypothetical protein